MSNDFQAAAIQAAIRDITDFPKPGVVFKDITPVLADPVLLRGAIDLLSNRHKDSRIDKIAAIDARGFLFGAAVADRLNAGLALIRKQGKLPHHTFNKEYSLEYGTDVLCIHQDTLHAGDRVLIVDDLLATGGTASAAAHLVEKGGGRIVEIEFLLELSFLNGRKNLAGYPIYSAVIY